MDWERVSNDQVDQVLGHLFAGTSVFLAEICDWLMVADRRQQFTADGSPDLVQWVSARFGLRHSTAGQLVRVARRLQDLPLLREKFAEGGLSLDQTDAISRMATPETEEALIVEALGLSNAVLDRAARRANPPSASDERTVWERRRLGLQWNLDESELKFGGPVLKAGSSKSRSQGERIGSRRTLKPGCSTCIRPGVPMRSWSSAPAAETSPLSSGSGHGSCRSRRPHREHRDHGNNRLSWSRVR
jgi:hypothetical protein